MPEFTSLSQIQVPVLGNSLAIGIVSLLHIAFAGLAVGLMLLAPLMEAFGRSNSLYLETAHSMTRFTLVTYTTSTVLAVIMAELFIGLFPQTNTWLFNQFRAPILARHCRLPAPIISPVPVLPLLGADTRQESGGASDDGRISRRSHAGMGVGVGWYRVVYAHSDYRTRLLESAS